MESLGPDGQVSNSLNPQDQNLKAPTNPDASTEDKASIADKRLISKTEQGPCLIYFVFQPSLRHKN